MRNLWFQFLPELIIDCWEIFTIKIWPGVEDRSNHFLKIQSVNYSS